jgi:hypothetical protein
MDNEICGVRWDAIEFFSLCFFTLVRSRTVREEILDYSLASRPKAQPF